MEQETVSFELSQHELIQSLAKKSEANDPEAERLAQTYLKRILHPQPQDDLDTLYRSTPAWLAVEKISSPNITLLASRIIREQGNPDLELHNRYVTNASLNLLSKVEVGKPSPDTKQPEQFTQDQINEIATNIAYYVANINTESPRARRILEKFLVIAGASNLQDSNLETIDSKFVPEVSEKSCVKFTAPYYKTNFPQTYARAISLAQQGIEKNPHILLEISKQADKADPELVEKHIISTLKYTDAAEYFLESVNRSEEYFNTLPWFETALTLAFDTLNKSSNHQKEKLSLIRPLSTVAIRAAFAFLNSKLKESALQVTAKFASGTAKYFLHDEAKRLHKDLRKNESRRNPFDSVEEAITNFQTKYPDTPVVYEQSGGYLDINTINSIFEAPISYKDLTHLRRIGYVQKSDVGKSYGAFITNALLHGADVNAVVEEMKSCLPAENRARAQQSQDEKTRSTSLTNDTSKNIINRIELTEASKLPLPFSEVLFIALEETNGNLNLALQATTEALKHMSRGSDYYHYNGGEWMRTRILDEFSPYGSFNVMLPEELAYKGNLRQMFSKFINTSHLEKQEGKTKIDYDESFPNRIGLPYHTADIISLLDTYPPEFIYILVLGEYALYGPNQGLIKFISDLSVIRDLPKINRLLRGFIVQDN